MALDVKVKIDLAKPIGSTENSIPLILEENATTEKPYVECRTLDEVIAAGFDTTTKTYKAANTIFMQENAPAKIAVCATEGDTATWLTGAANIGRAWRQLLVVNNTEAAIAVVAIAKAIEAIDYKMYFADVALEDTTVKASEMTGFERTVLFYCEATTDYPSPVAALVGATAGLNPGSFTYKNMILKGIAPQDLSDPEITAIHDKGGFTFVTKAGDNVTTEGKTVGGEYIDIVDSKDYILSNIAYKTQKVLNTRPKVGWNNNDIGLLENAAATVLKTGHGFGMIADNADGTPAYSTNYAKREDTEAVDRAERKYKGGKFHFKLDGAVHEADINGSVEI